MNLSSNNGLFSLSGIEESPAEQVVLCRASREQEIQSQRSNVNSIQQISEHIHIFGYIFWEKKKTRTISYPPYPSLSPPICETSV